MSSTSGLYRGLVTHRRLRPRDHRLRYSAFWMLLDLGEIDGLAARLALFSRNRFNLLSFHDDDHGEPGAGPLRDQVERRLADAGVRLDGGAIRLLTMPRVLGYVFNPISVYYCHRPDGGLAAIVYEVNNTFGDRHAYVISVRREDAERGAIRQHCRKALYVSPFAGLDMIYRFRGAVPGAGLSLAVEAVDAGGPLIVAAMVGRRFELSDRAILATALRLPFSTLKVLAAIHWEALKLWFKGVPLVPRPKAEAAAAANVRLAETRASSRSDLRPSDNPAA